MRKNMMKGREGNRGATPSTDLLVCFPSRAHLSLMPKPICSPARPSEPNKRHQHPHHRRNRSVSRGGGGGGPGGQGSPMLWNKTKSMGSDISEPTSPKVTCAGQIKVRPKSSGCRSWQSVMEEIEKIHNDKKQKKRLNWAESLGFKKEVMQFLTCLRTIRFDLPCLGSFSGTSVISDDEEDEEEEDDEEEDEVYRENENHVSVEENEKEGSKTVFSKWFMVLQEDQNKEKEENGNENGEEESVAPPPNALLLMRCRSAPAKSWLRESEGGDGNDEKEEETHKEKEKEKGEVKRGQSLKSLMEEDKNKMVVNVMRCHSDYCGISTDIATETWIVDGNGIRDLMSRSRSWKK